MKQIINDLNGWITMWDDEWENIKSGIKKYEGTKMNKDYVSGWKIITGIDKIDQNENETLYNKVFSSPKYGTPIDINRMSFAETKKYKGKWYFMIETFDYEIYEILGFINIQDPYANPRLIECDGDGNCQLPYDIEWGSGYCPLHGGDSDNDEEEELKELFGISKECDALIVDKQSYDFWKENYDKKHDWILWNIKEWKAI